jgi:hypothetical protein
MISTSLPRHAQFEVVRTGFDQVATFRPPSQRAGPHLSLTAAFSAIDVADRCSFGIERQHIDVSSAHAVLTGEIGDWYSFFSLRLQHLAKLHQLFS